MTPPSLALTLWQPWASLLLVADPRNSGAPPKEFETRGWKPPVRMQGERILIHAAAHVPGDVRRRLIALGEFREPFRSILLRCGISLRDPWERGYDPVRGMRLPLGALIGSVCVGDIIPTDAAQPWIAHAKRHAWAIANARRSHDPLETAHHTPGDPLATARPSPSLAVVDEFTLGDYTDGRFAWRVMDPVAFPEPIPCAGGQKLWTVPEDLAARARRMTAEGLAGLAPMLVRG
jgi:hypothetical protein